MSFSSRVVRGERRIGGKGRGGWKVGWLNKQHSDTILQSVKIVYNVT